MEIKKPIGSNLIKGQQNIIIPAGWNKNLSAASNVILSLVFTNCFLHDCVVMQSQAFVSDHGTILLKMF